MRLIIILFAAAMLTSGGTRADQANVGIRRAGVLCPRCAAYCRLSVSQDEVKKSYWDVERATICIPPITFPWQQCGSGKCARTKVVRVLKKVEYSCPQCKYQWTPVGDTDCRGAGGDRTAQARLEAAPKAAAPSPRAR